MLAIELQYVSMKHPSRSEDDPPKSIKNLRARDSRDHIHSKGGHTALSQLLDQRLILRGIHKRDNRGSFPEGLHFIEGPLLLRAADFQEDIALGVDRGPIDQGGTRLFVDLIQHLGFLPGATFDQHTGKAFLEQHSHILRGESDATLTREGLSGHAHGQGGIGNDGDWGGIRRAGGVSASGLGLWSGQELVVAAVGGIIGNLSEREGYWWGHIVSYCAQR